jgi:hypothetical protein
MINRKEERLGPWGREPGGGRGGPRGCGYSPCSDRYRRIGSAPGGPGAPQAFRSWRLPALFATMVLSLNPCFLPSSLSSLAYIFVVGAAVIWSVLSARAAHRILKHGGDAHIYKKTCLCLGILLLFFVSWVHETTVRSASAFPFSRWCEKKDDAKQRPDQL